MPDRAVAARPRANLVEYLAEAWALGLFMLAACGFGVLLFHPASPAVRAVPDPLVRRALMGLAMGLTAVGNIYSPWGRRSGAHMNPATTLAFFRLGKVAPRDALGYVAGQFAGGLAGVGVAALFLGRWLADPAVNYVVTVPGPWGPGAAFLAEAAITLLLMVVVLWCAAAPRLAPYTGLAAGALVALYITIESPVSGMSMNPARTLASAVPALHWRHLWIYFAAPPLGMLAAAELRRRAAPGARHCAKHVHDPRYRCVFCEHQARARASEGTTPAGPAFQWSTGATDSRRPDEGARPVDYQEESASCAASVR